MPEQIITTTREMNRITSSMLEAVDSASGGLDGFSDVEKAKFLAQLPRAMEEIKNSEKTPRVMSTPQHQFASVLQSLVASNAKPGEQLASGAFEAMFDTNDWFGWAKTAWHILVDARNKFPWQAPPPQPEVIPQFKNRAKLDIISDWGTGLYGAPVIANTISADKPNIIMHLGDVYYSGTEGEFKDRFSKFWPKYDGALHRALNGNHEMYSGGRPYVQAIQRAPFSQKSTCFAYQNDHWILIGLDTAYQDFDLYQDEQEQHDEVKWLNGIVDKAEGRRIVLFSHHQPFSIFDKPGPKLVAKMGDYLLKTGKIFAWYWGHEHQCVIYDRHLGWKMYGRCVGHSGMPEFRKLSDLPSAKPAFRKIPGKDEAPAALVLDGRNDYITGEENKFSPHGFVSLEFDDDRLVESYRNPDGSLIMPSQELAR